VFKEGFVVGFKNIKPKNMTQETLFGGTLGYRQRWTGLGKNT
jgi:hypothetical protein